MRLYIAGPMAGYPDANRENFLWAEDALTKAGYEIVSPRLVNEACMLPMGDERWLHCMKQDIRMIVECDGVAVLHGHEMSKGACVETFLARALNMEVRTVGEWLIKANFR